MTSARRRWLAAIFLLAALAPAPARAGRPLETEDTGTVEPGQAELELGGEFARNPQDRSWLVTGVLNVGLLPRLEGRIESGVLFQDPDGERGRAGIGDSLLGLKYRLIEEEASIPAVLGQLTLRLPTNDEEPGRGPNRLDVGLLVAASKAFGPVTLTGNAGYTFVTSGRALDFWTLAASIEYRIARLWSLVGEVVSTLSTGGPDTAVLRTGAVYAVSERVKLDGAVGVGLTRQSSDYVITVGITIDLF